jgi:hypothetical protein
MKYIICLLAINFKPHVFSFYEKLMTENTEIYMCFDSNANIHESPNKNIKFIYVDNKLCKNNGFKSTH